MHDERNRAHTTHVDAIDAALGDDVRADAALTREYERIVRAVRDSSTSTAAPDRVLNAILARQANGRPGPKAATPGRFTLLSAALTFALALVTTGVPTLFTSPPASFASFASFASWNSTGTAPTAISMTADLSTRFAAASPEFAARPASDELDTTSVLGRTHPASLH